MRLLLTILLLTFGLSYILVAQEQVDSSLSYKDKTNIKYDILGLSIDRKSVDFNTEHYKHKAFFCRLEDQLFNKSGKNIIFRLGNLEYVDILEHKQSKLNTNY